MRRVVLVAIVCAAVPLPATAAETAECNVPPRITSPTGSRLIAGHALTKTVTATSDMVNDDGSISVKAPWRAYGPRGRPHRGPRGVLSISGRRVDASAAPLRARTQQIWQDGFTGSGMWAVVLTFPQPGCWSITGRVERTRITFRVRVIAPTYFANPY
jgi:hypothetical protein